VENGSAAAQGNFEPWAICTKKICAEYKTPPTLLAKIWWDKWNRARRLGKAHPLVAQ
jgi:hypothetical protein